MISIKKLLLSLLFFTVAITAYSQVQTINMPTNATERYVGCNNAFLNDSGGPAGNYGNNENGELILCPIIPTDRMQFNIGLIDIGPNDVLTIYDGDDNTAPVLYTASNTTTAPGVIEASPTNSTGCLFITFVSDGTNTNNAGWRATRGCFDPCQTITPSITTTPATDADGILRICQGTTVNFDGSATFSLDGTGATYEWDLGNGNGTVTGQMVSETYASPGIYNVQFTVTDNIGCTDREEIDLIIFVSTDPDFTGTQPDDTTICFGDSTDITGVVTPVEFSINPTPPVAGQTFLPDGSGVSYQTCINVDIFTPGAVVTNASDIVDIFLEMEHSYLGDLEVTIISPNGQTAVLHQYSNGGGTFLGIPIDNDSDLSPGRGFLYYFTEQRAATQTWAQAAAANATIPAGDYLPFDPYTNLIGSPLNGQWCIDIVDNLGSDNGYIFQWGINFDPAIIPGEFNFTPGSSATRWLPDPSITATNGDVITVTPTTEGLNCYTYEFTDSFGCIYTEQVCITVEQEILDAAPNDIVECGTLGTTAVDLTVNTPIVLNGLNPADFSVAYHNTLNDAENATNPIANPSAYVTTTSPETVYVSITNLANSCIEVDPAGFQVSIIDFGTVTIPDINSCTALVNFDLQGYVNSSLSGGGGGTVGTNFTMTFHTSQADATTGANPIPLPYNQAAGTVTIWIRIVSTADPSCNAVLPFDITVNQTITGPVNDIVVCDDASNDGVEVFDLTTQDADVQSVTGGNVTYFETLADASANTNAITNPTGYSNISNPQIIYARLENPIDPSCFDVAQFAIQVDYLGVYNTASDMVVCDDVTNDGIEIFDLTTQEVDILNGQNPADVTITYHLSQGDADANINAIATPSSYTNGVVGGEQIFVRVEGVPNAACYTTGSFNIVVNELPVATTPNDMVVCDDASNDGVEVFDLTSQDASIQTVTTGNISYFESMADATSNTNPITNSTAYSNTSNPQTIYARLENSSNTACFDVVQFALQVDYLGVFNTAQDIIVCDDVSNDGIEIFDLTSQEVDILNGQNPVDVLITYYLSQSDADAATNAIASPSSYTNSTIGGEQIFVRVEGVPNGSCFTTGSFNLVVNELPVATSPADLVVCDDPSNDGIENFNLSTQDAAILNGLNAADYVITYFSSQANADSNTNPLNSTSYDNTAATETIYVRMESVVNATCFSTVNFDIIVNPAPSIINGNDLELCDDISGDGIEVFDLSQNDAVILNGLNPADYTITYHASQTDADSAINPLNTNYSNTSTSETIYASVVNNTTGCSNTSSFNITVNPIPQTVTVSDLEVCDDDNDGVGMFSLSDRTAEITNGQSAVVTFYESQADAVSQTNPLDGNSYNNISNPQTIHYRLENASTGCFAVGTFEIEALAAPNAFVATPLESCDDGTGIATVDLTTAIPEITGGQTSDVTFHETSQDAQDGINPLNANYDFSGDTTVFVRVEIPGLGCEGFTTLDLLFNDLPDPQLLPQYILCRDENGVLINGPELLDTGLNNQDYSFEWTRNGTIIAGASDSFLNATEDGDYEVVVTDLFTGCQQTENTNVRFSGIPLSYDVEVTTDPFDFSHNIFVTTEGPDQYWFSLDGGPYQDSPYFNDVSPGPHTMAIAERTGCGEVVVEVFVYGYPDYFTPNADGYHDTWNIIGGDRLPGTQVYIFDRYGKFLKQIATDGPGWDGTFNGEPLPSSDYWFKIEYQFEGQSAEATGHFALKR